jgi:hypothetical protein
MRTLKHGALIQARTLGSPRASRLLQLTVHDYVIG